MFLPFPDIFSLLYSLLPNLCQKKFFSNIKSDSFNSLEHKYLISGKRTLFLQVQHLSPKQQLWVNDLKLEEKARISVHLLVKFAMLLWQKRLYVLQKSQVFVGMWDSSKFLNKFFFLLGVTHCHLLSCSATSMLCNWRYNHGIDVGMAIVEVLCPLSYLCSYLLLWILACVTEFRIWCIFLNFEKIVRIQSIFLHGNT